MQQAKKWKLFDAAPAEFLNGIPEEPLLLQVLYNRGLRTPQEVEAFLKHTDAVVVDPYRLQDMPAAVTRIVQAIKNDEVICVYGDFDADGVTSTALLVTALQAAGGRVGPYIPDRVDEGYGLNVDAITRIAEKAKLLVTVDCGIRSVAEVAHAVKLGLDVIVTDHHSVGPMLPPALAVVNPRRADCRSGSKQLAGVGVAYRLAQGVLRSVAHQRWSKLDAERAQELEQELLDYVAIGTVADIMPLLGENRLLVQKGLEQLNQTQRAGLQALLAASDQRTGTVDATAISFRLAPRINAAGRLSQTQLAYELLRTNDPVKAYNLAMQLEALNKQRRDLTAAAQDEAEQLLALQFAERRAQIQEGADGDGAFGDEQILVVHSPNFQAGVVGLVAGKLTDRYYRPAVVIEEKADESRGSARSIEEFDISAALDEVTNLLVRHGGHSRAAGFTVETAKLPLFKEALQDVAHRELAAKTDLRPTLLVDAAIEIGQINWALVEQFKRLEPTGQENPAPLLLCTNCRLREARPVGDRKHLRLILDGGANTIALDAIAFQQGAWLAHLHEGCSLDVVCHVEANEWQGRQRLQLNVQDMRLAENVIY
ncbi:MAG: single-stranded-DNA-specific exonuclease RecJ [Caldilineaceae bacterium]